MWRNTHVAPRKRIARDKAFAIVDKILLGHEAAVSFVFADVHDYWTIPGKKTPHELSTIS